MDQVALFPVYLWAVFGHWQAYATGGGVTALMLVYERLFKPIPPTVFRWIVLVFFVVAATFSAWHDAYTSMKGRESDLHASQIETLAEHKKLLEANEYSKPDLVASIGQLAVFRYSSSAYPPPNVGLIFVVHMVNKGSPSIIDVWRLIARPTGMKPIVLSPTTLPVNPVRISHDLSFDASRLRKKGISPLETANIRLGPT